MGDRRYFRNALASGQLSSGEYVVSRATTRPAFNLAYPLKDRHGAIAGVISVGFVIDRYREILNNMSLLPGTSYVLSDHRGVVLSRAIDPERYIGTPYPANEFRKIQEGPDSGTSIRAGIAGDKRIISYRKLRLAGEQGRPAAVAAGRPAAPRAVPPQQQLAAQQEVGQGGRQREGAGVQVDHLFQAPRHHGELTGAQLSDTGLQGGGARS